MKDTVFRIVLVLLIVVVLLFLLSQIVASLRPDYDEGWIIGKTASEIEARYGSFDLPGSIAEDGNYYNCGCAYRTKEARVGFFGTDPDEFFMIYFNGEGKAYDIKYPWFVPGG